MNLRSAAIRELSIQRLMQRFYAQRLINNVHRGDYVECMIELALAECDPAWRLTKPWTSWDLVHRKTFARIEVKQSAALQPWLGPPAHGKFDIEPRTGYYSEDGAWTKTPQPQRHADLYVFAWHPEKDADIADHRRPDQWKFFVVAETCLPEKDGIGLKALNELVERCNLAEHSSYDALAAKVANVLKSFGSLKASARRSPSE